MGNHRKNAEFYVFYVVDSPKMLFCQTRWSIFHFKILCPFHTNPSCALGQSKIQRDFATFYLNYANYAKQATYGGYPKYIYGTIRRTPKHETKQGRFNEVI